MQQVGGGTQRPHQLQAPLCVQVKAWLQSGEEGNSVLLNRIREMNHAAQGTRGTRHTRGGMKGWRWNLTLWFTSRHSLGTRTILSSEMKARAGHLHCRMHARSPVGLPHEAQVTGSREPAVIRTKIRLWTPGIKSLSYPHPQHPLPTIKEKIEERV